MNRFLNHHPQQIDVAIQKGTRYLLSIFNNGHWQGFPTLAGTSDIWVTGFVTAHLRPVTNNEGWLQKVQDYILNARHPTGGWSYNAFVPADADSTSWCLMALSGCSDFTDAQNELSKNFLWSHFANNGLSTYKADSGIHTFIGVPDPLVVAGWTSPHPDVSAAALLADITNTNAETVIEHLMQLQTDEAMIPAYWWRTHFYTLVLLLRAFAKSGRQLSAEQQQLISNTLAKHQLSNGGFSLHKTAAYNSFATALALELYTHLSETNVAAAMQQCVNILLQTQKEDGSWEGDHLLRIPAPYIHDPETVTEWNTYTGGGNAYIFDDAGLFTTTMACYALNCLLKTQTDIPVINH